MADYIYNKSNGKPTTVEKLTTTFKQNGKLESVREILKFLQGFKDTDNLMEWVNEKIQISNEHYKGTYASLALLEAVQGADEEDFGYVISVDQHGNTIYQRYKYINGSWVYQYDTTNPEFSDAEWAAIRSGITAALVTKLSALPTNEQLTLLLSEKLSKSEFADVIDTMQMNEANGDITISYDDGQPDENNNEE